MKRLIIFLIIGTIVIGSNLFSRFYANYTCITFPDQCDQNQGIIIQQTSQNLGQLIPEAAVYFLESSRDFNDFLKEVEKSEIGGPNFVVFKATIEKAITGMENAQCKYEDILNISKSLEMDVIILEKLIKFDYYGMKSKYNLNPSIFERASTFCQTGDIIGIYNYTFEVINTILGKLRLIKATLEQESMPELYIIWEVGQLYFESEMFGQYISRIFYEINTEVNRN